MRHPLHARGPFAVTLCAGTLLLAGCFPRPDYSGLPDPSVIAVTGSGPGAQAQAVPPECKTMLIPSAMTTDDDRHTWAFGCATYTNLARTIAQPNDLIDPRPFAGASAVREEGAVQRYYDNKTTPLKSNTTVTHN